MDPRALRRSFLGGLYMGLRVVWPVLSILVGLIAALGLLTGVLEGWSMQESIYFAFVSGLTIGLVSDDRIDYDKTQTKRLAVQSLKKRTFGGRFSTYASLSGQEMWSKSSPTARFRLRSARWATFRSTHKPVPRRTMMTSNSALVSDVCAAALRAFFNAPQRGR